MSIQTLKLLFPFTVKYKSVLKVPLKETEKINALAYIKRYVENLGGKDIIVYENSLSFKSKSFFRSWAELGLIDRGTFHLTENALTFRFTMTRTFIVAALLSLLFAYSSGEVNIAIFFFLILGFGNWLLALILMKNMNNKLSLEISSLTP